MKDYFVLSNGVKIPSIGFGTWQIPDGTDCYLSVMLALKLGYRHIDTALAYGNERSVGKAIRDSKLKREEVFVTTKLPAQYKTYDEAIKYFNESLENLGLNYIDLYLIHAPWPWAEVGKDCTKGNVEVWKAFVKLYNEGKVKSIGVSNFRESDIRPLVEETNFMPHVNQIRFFISNIQEDVVKYCKENNILVEAYSPLGTGKLLGNEEINEVAKKYNVSAARLCIKYCLQKDTLPLPKSTHEDRIKANLEMDFDISDEDMKKLDNVKIEELYRELRS